jgi:hypothetical protein
MSCSDATGTYSLSPVGVGEGQELRRCAVHLEMRQPEVAAHAVLAVDHR